MTAQAVTMTMTSTDRGSARDNERSTGDGGLQMGSLPKQLLNQLLAVG